MYRISILLTLLAYVSVTACGEDTTGPSGGHAGDPPDSVSTVLNVGGEPRAICALPSGDRLYVTNAPIGNVLVLSAPDGTAIDTVDLGGISSDLDWICNSPSGQYVYVVGEGDMYIIRTSDNLLVWLSHITALVTGVCPHPSGEYVYVSGYYWERNTDFFGQSEGLPGEKKGYNGEISVIDANDFTVVEEVEIDQRTQGVCADPSGEYVYLCAGGDLYRLRTSDNSFVDTLDLSGSREVCCLPQGDYLYVSAGAGDLVSVIDVDEFEVVSTIPLGEEPTAICAHPSGEYVYVTNSFDDTVSLIRTSDNCVVSTISVGSKPWGVEVLPSGEYVYVTNLEDGTVSVVQ